MIGSIITRGLGAFSAAWRIITHGFGIAEVVVYATPAERTIDIPAESRYCLISAENRTVKVPSNDRTVLV